eukprot:SAG11_NODE_6910_length_1227_cov_3.105496_1_plen_179_part_10
MPSTLLAGGLLQAAVAQVPPPSRPRGCTRSRTPASLVAASLAASASAVGGRPQLGAVEPRLAAADYPWQDEADVTCQASYPAGGPFGLRFEEEATLTAAAPDLEGGGHPAHPAAETTTEPVVEAEERGGEVWLTVAELEPEYYGRAEQTAANRWLGPGCLLVAVGAENTIERPAAESLA